MSGFVCPPEPKFPLAWGSRAQGGGQGCGTENPSSDLVFPHLIISLEIIFFPAYESTSFLQWLPGVLGGNANIYSTSSPMMAI